MSTVLILGATSDMARATAHCYADAGYDLVLAARRPDALAADATDLGIRYDVAVQTVAFDARAYASHADFAETLEPLPDGVLCFVGYLGDQVEAQGDWEMAQQILETNYVGCISVLERLAEAFEARGSGFIVGVSSVAGDRGRPSNYLYGSAKAGFQAYLSGLRGRLFMNGITVLDVRPGFVATKMTEGLPLPSALTAQPESVARDIFKAQQKGTDIRYTLWFWRYIMRIIKSIPTAVFKRLSL